MTYKQPYSPSKKVWQSCGIGRHTQSHTPIKSSMQSLSILSKRLYLAPTQKVAARIPVSQSIWLPDTVGTIPFVTQIQWFLEWAGGRFSPLVQDCTLCKWTNKRDSKKRHPYFGFASILETALDGDLYLSSDFILLHPLVSEMWLRGLYMHVHALAHESLGHSQDLFSGLWLQGLVITVEVIFRLFILFPQLLAFPITLYDVDI